MASELTAYDTIGKRIKIACVERSMKKNELAKAIGCGAGHMSELVNDKQKPSLDLLERLSSTLDKPVDYFLTGETYYCKSYVIQEEFVEIVDGLDPQRLKTYLTLGYALLKEQEQAEKVYQDKLKLME